jgi:hypothetical protein
MAGHHNRIAASGSPQWIECHGQPALVDQLKKDGVLKEQTSTVPSVLGTICHSVLEHCIIKRVSPFDITQKFLKQIIQLELADYDLKGEHRAFASIKLQHHDLHGINKYWEYIEANREYYDETFAEI